MQETIYIKEIDKSELDERATYVFDNYQPEAIDYLYFKLTDDQGKLVTFGRANILDEFINADKTYGMKSVIDFATPVSSDEETYNGIVKWCSQFATNIRGTKVQNKLIKTDLERLYEDS